MEEIHTKSYKAVIFDLDGVVTKTADLHAKAWKELFDQVLKKWATEKGEPFTPFDEANDYLTYVDGKPRYEGIKSFLTSRGIYLPFGTTEDSPSCWSTCGLANKKNALFLEEIERSGVEVYKTTVSLIRQLKAAGIKVGLITSSKNCVPILKETGLLGLFDVKIDGIDAEKMGLKGKPSPDIFLEAARQLGVEPREAIIVEDAISGVQAGNRGGFALVIGLDRAGQSEALEKAGADCVVEDLREVHFG